MATLAAIYITNNYMIKGYQQKIFHKGSNGKVNASFILD
jgi:hypothetical protein